LISVEQALEKILSKIEVLEEQEIGILESLGQILSQDICSDIDVPPKDNSALDGYAFRVSDIKGASLDHPRVLRVIDIVIAGDNPKKKVEPGTAIRIMTGAPVPQGADCVIGFEDTDEAQRKLNDKGFPDEIGIMVELKPNSNVRKAGESLRKGATALAAGTLIRPSEIGVLASMGKNRVKVIRRPVVAILATGDEVTELGEPLKEGKLYNSNSYSIASQVLREGGIPRLLGIALDNPSSVENKIREARDADLLITTGGVSMGDYDIVKEVLAKEGQMVFWKVRTKPGKPLAFGDIRRTGKKALPHLGLAGNAVSCMINFELFARPVIQKMMGKKNFTKPTIQAIIDDEIKNDDGRRVFARVIVERRDGGYHARLTGPQGSGILTSMTMANGLAIVPEDIELVRKGDTLSVMMLDWYQDI